MALSPAQQRFLALQGRSPIEYSLPINEFTNRLTALVLSADSEFILKAGGNFTKILKLYQQQTARSNKSVVKVNQRIAKAMIQGVVEGYNATVNRGGLKPEPYRRRDSGKDRRYSGKLLAAIKDPNFAQGTENGIQFINVAELDVTALHWKRLNFGAGPNQGYEGVKYPAPKGRIRFGSGQGFNIPGVSGEPRPNFNVPQRGYGYFNNEGQFYPLRKKTGYGIVGYIDKKGKHHPGRSPTTGQFQKIRGIRRIKSEPSKHGIGARHFLDHGLVALGKEFGPQYKRYFEESAKKAASEAARVAAKKTEVSLRVPGLQGNIFRGGNVGHKRR